MAKYAESERQGVGLGRAGDRPRCGAFDLRCGGGRGLIRREGWTPEDYAKVYEALKSEASRLKLWAVVYTHELDPEWRPLLPFIDVVHLWVWKSQDLFKLDEHVALCQSLFPDKPIILGCYLRDYTARAAVPMDMLRFQWEKVHTYVTDERIAGYAILGTVLIDGHQEQSQWIRSFISQRWT